MAPSSIWIEQENAIITEIYVGDKTARDVLAALQDAGYKGKTLGQVRGQIARLKLSKVERGPPLPHATTVVLITRVITQKANDEANGTIRPWSAYKPSQMTKSQFAFYGVMVNNGTWEAWKQPRQYSTNASAVQSRTWRRSARAAAREAAVVGAPPPLPIVGDDEIAAARAVAAEAAAASGMEDVSF